MTEPSEQTVVPLRPGRPVRPASARTAAPEPLLRHVVGAILRRARLQQGRTLHDVAAAAQVSTAYLSEVERGRKEPSSEVLAAVCRALGIRLVDLVARAQDDLVDAARVRVLRSTVSTSARTAGRHEVRSSSSSRLQRSGLQGMLLAA